MCLTFVMGLADRKRAMTAQTFCMHTPSPVKRTPQARSEDCHMRAVPWHCAEARSLAAPPSPFAEENNGETMAVAMAHWLDKVVERYDAMEKVKPSVITVREPFRPNHFRERNFCLKFLCPNIPPPFTCRASALSHRLP